MPYVTTNKLEQSIVQNNNCYIIDFKGTKLNLNIREVDITDLIDIHSFKQAIEMNKIILIKNLIVGDFEMKSYQSNYTYILNASDSYDGQEYNYKVYGYLMSLFFIVNSNLSLIPAPMGGNVFYIPEEYKDLPIEDAQYAGKVILKLVVID